MGNAPSSSADRAMGSTRAVRYTFPVVALTSLASAGDTRPQERSSSQQRRRSGIAMLFQGLRRLSPTALTPAAVERGRGTSDIQGMTHTHTHVSI